MGRRRLALYTNSPRAVVNELGLVPADVAIASVAVRVPQDGEVLSTDVAPVGLVPADLLTLPTEVASPGHRGGSRRRGRTSTLGCS